MLTIIYCLGGVVIVDDCVGFRRYENKYSADMIYVTLLNKLIAFRTDRPSNRSPVEQIAPHLSETLKTDFSGSSVGEHTC